MRTFLLGIIVVGVIAAVIIVPQTLYIVDVTQTAIVTRLGAFKRSELSSGLKIKTPFVEKVTKFDKRLLRYDAPAASLLTADKRNLLIDAYARYRIVDPLVFFQTLRDENQANSRVGDIIASELRREVALDLQTEIISEIREKIMDRVRRAANRSDITRDDAQAIGFRDPTITILVTPKVDTSGDDVAERRRPVTQEELTALESDANPAILEGFEVQYFEPLRTRTGIEIVDVRIKRADFPDAVATSVFARMQAERQRIASALRAEGAQQDAEIRAETDRDVTVTLQTAEGGSSRLRGEGEGEAIAILAKELERDPEFYRFQRALTAYRTLLDSQTTVVLSADSPLFEFLQDPAGVAAKD